MKFDAKKGRLVVPFFFFIFILAQSLFSATITYQEDLTTNFKNPERGIRDGSGTLGRVYFSLESYRNVDALPQSFLNNVSNECANYRNAGRKIIPRFRYAWTSGGDAMLQRILGHIEQIGPVLKENADVIAMVEVGFLGCFGEWHYFNCSDQYSNGNTTSRKAVLLKLLDVLPKDRMVVLRYDYYKRQIFGNSAPLGPDSAFSGSPRARTGFHNDCFRFDSSDRGTYHEPNTRANRDTIEAQKNYLNQDNRYVPQEGESCGSSSLSACDSAIKDLKRMHWDGLAISSFISQWSNGGCLNKILMSFGYRIVLRTAQLPDCARPGYNYNGSINLQNVGWGKIYNPRDCELVFRNTATKSKTIVKLTNDPRHWCMREDTLVNVLISAPIPANMPEGTYQVYLNLPDPYPSLHNRKEYSIRLANNNVWEDSTGYNSLQCIVAVSKNCVVGTIKSDAAVFKALESVRVKKQNGSIEFDLPGTMPAPITLEIFALSGAKIWSRTVMPGENGARTVKWTGGSSSVYLWKVFLNDKGSSHAATGAIRSLMVNRN